MDLARLVHLAAEIEIYVFGVAFLASVCILSIASALFIVRAVLEHTFPGWRDGLKRLTARV